MSNEIGRVTRRAALQLLPGVDMPAYIRVNLALSHGQGS